MFGLSMRGGPKKVAHNGFKEATCGARDAVYHGGVGDHVREDMFYEENSASHVEKVAPPPPPKVDRNLSINGWKYCAFGAP